MARTKLVDGNSLKQSHERTMLDEFFDSDVGDCTGQTFMFEIDEFPAQPPPFVPDPVPRLVDGTKLTPRRLEHWQRSLLAKFLSVAHGLPLAMTAKVLGVSEGTASRLIAFHLPVSVQPMRERTNGELVLGERGISVTKSPQAGACGIADGQFTE